MRYRRLATALSVAGLLAGGAHAQPAAVHDDTQVVAKPSFGGESSPIRPGAKINDACTLNFVFYDPTTPAPPPVYIGTAAHCTSKVGQRARLSSGRAFGTVVFDSDTTRSKVDFSLIRIDGDMVSKTNPKALGWGGPRGVASVANLGVGDRVDMYGHGALFGTQPATRARWGVLAGWTAKEYAADIPAVNGDSGAPVLHHPTGKALGMVSRYGVTATPPSTDTGPLLSWIFKRLSRAGFTDLVLATAK